MQIFLVAFTLLSALFSTNLQANEIVELCFKKIESAQNTIQAEYQSRLIELRQAFQEQGDLNLYLKVQAELDRLDKGGKFTSENLVKSQNPLRWIQEQMIQTMEERIYQIAVDHIAILEPKVKELTMAGEIDQAVLTLQSIETIRIQYEDIFKKFAPNANKKIDYVNSAQFSAFCADNEDFAKSNLLGKRLRLVGKIKSAAQDFSNSKMFRIQLVTKNSDDEAVHLLIPETQYTWEIQKGTIGPAFHLIPPRGKKEAQVIVIQPGIEIEVLGTFSRFHLCLEFNQIMFPPDSAINEMAPSQPEDEENGKAKGQKEN